MGSSLMYAIGLAIALYAQDASVATMMLALNLGFAALGIVLLSTITTTFLDAYSAGVTFTNIFPKMSERKVAFVMAIIGLVVALLMPIEEYESFLYAIGSVFGPLFAIVLCDYFIAKKEQIDARLVLHVGSLLVWGVGVGLYYWFITLDLLVGATLPTMVSTGILWIVTRKAMASWTLTRN